jgi:hypothetical protein
MVARERRARPEDSSAMVYANHPHHRDDPETARAGETDPPFQRAWVPALETSARTGTKALRSNGRAASVPWPVPLTVLGELLHRHNATPYKACRRWGMRNWILAQVREFLTRGAEYCLELDLERTIRFNAGYLEKRARFVLARRRSHRGRVLDGEALAEVLGMSHEPAMDFCSVWVRYVGQVADDLVYATRDGHAEDIVWKAAEEYLDKVVAPRARSLSKFNAAPDRLVQSQWADEPVSMLGGCRRINRILDGLGSPDPAVAAAMLGSWDVLRLRDPDLEDDVRWDDETVPFGGISLVI